MSVSPNQYQKEFMATPLATTILQQLKQMEESTLYVTKPSYKPGGDGDVTFSDKHFSYISTHPTVRPKDYMANLRLMTKIH